MWHAIKSTIQHLPETYERVYFISGCVLIFYSPSYKVVGDVKTGLMNWEIKGAAKIRPGSLWAGQDEFEVVDRFA